MSESRRRRRKNAKINNTLLVILLVVMFLTVIAFILNTIRVQRADTGKGETIEETETAENEFTNEYYSIGYNATDINKEYFCELDDLVENAIEADKGSEGAKRDNAQIASSLVKCFVTEYYTWTNKDGNYDIGGIQYIFRERQADFERYTRYSFYADMDLYLSQYDRENLIQVKDVTIKDIYQSESFYMEETGASYDCWTVDAAWTYESGSVMNTSEIQKEAEFLVVNHDGRLEIAAIDKPEEPEETEEPVYDQNEWGN
ncbi:MAG: hypothetical protein IJM63_00565 [Solobacterium sp.]|nr:hypothetical protein [Solobacterium sp.]